MGFHKGGRYMPANPRSTKIWRPLEIVVTRAGRVREWSQGGL